MAMLSGLWFRLASKAAGDAALQKLRHVRGASAIREAPGVPRLPPLWFGVGLDYPSRQAAGDWMPCYGWRRFALNAESGCACASFLVARVFSTVLRLQRLWPCRLM